MRQGGSSVAHRIDAGVAGGTPEIEVCGGRVRMPRGLLCSEGAGSVHDCSSEVAATLFCIYNNLVRISYDPRKRKRTLAERGLDFEDAALVFEGVTVEVEDVRRNYGERRIICYGLLAGRLVVVGYTPRGPVRHIFSMRKANDREQTRLAPYFGL